MAGFHTGVGSIRGFGPQGLRVQVRVEIFKSATIPWTNPWVLGGLGRDSAEAFPDVEPRVDQRPAGTVLAGLAGRWELWARAEDGMIPRLKTTMMVESHWRRIKKDFLHHFHMPRLDLLVWILVKKLAPSYYRKLDTMFVETGRFRELASWRKAFKREWKRSSTDDSESRATLDLIPYQRDDLLLPDHGSDHSDDDNGIELVDTRAGTSQGTFNERLAAHIGAIRDFCDGLECQQQFNDPRVLDALEREGASFLRFAQGCLSRERRQNSSRSVTPATWERPTSSAMFYRARPRLSDQES
ncbi:hypothetical protein DFH09DRAFT_1067827 [Mycena vulgaris]|nr:hypothetical protein DFH09DRAFT_1067827 [Mycena vulgaris]